MPENFIPVIAITFIAFLVFSGGLAYGQFITGPGLRREKREPTTAARPSMASLGCPSKAGVRGK
jgi:hypothetical protein